MSRGAGTRDAGKSVGSAASSSAPTGTALLVGAGAFLRRLSFWSAIVLPFVAFALLAVQPAGWGAAIVGVFALDLFAVYLGHCHDRGC